MQTREIEEIQIDDRQRGFFYGYIVVAAGFGVWLISFGTYTTFGILFRPVSNEFQWNRADATLGYSLSIIVMAIVSIQMGWLTDKLGPRIVVTIFGSFLGISYLLISQVNSLWQFQICYAVVTAIGMSTPTSPVMATVARWFVKKRGVMTGFVQSGLGIGGLVFAPLCGLLVLSYGWRDSYVILGTIALTGIVISGLFLKRNPKDANQLKNGGRETTDKSQKGIIQGHPISGQSLREAITQNQFWIITGLYSCFGFCRSTFLVHTAAHVQDLGFSLSDAANVTAVLTLASIIGRVGMGRVADVIGSRSALVMSYAVTSFAMIWGLFTYDLWSFYVFAVLFGIGWGAQAVLRIVVTSEVFGLASIGLFIAVLGLPEAAAGALGSYYAGYLFDIFGNYASIFWIGIAISIMGIILAGLLKPIARE